MPRLLQRQQAPFEGRIAGRVPGCIACGNHRHFWVRRDDDAVVANAWEIRSTDKIVACGRCRARNSVVYSQADS